MVCLWVPHWPEYTLSEAGYRSLVSQIRSDSLGKEISWVYYWSVGSPQWVAAHGCSPWHFVMVCYYTSCNNRITLKEFFLTYSTSLRVIGLPSTATQRSCRLCKVQSIEISLLAKVWQSFQLFRWNSVQKLVFMSTVSVQLQREQSTTDGGIRVIFWDSWNWDCKSKRRGTQPFF